MRRKRLCHCTCTLLLDYLCMQYKLNVCFYSVEFVMASSRDVHHIICISSLCCISTGIHKSDHKEPNTSRKSCDILLQCIAVMDPWAIEMSNKSLDLCFIVLLVDVGFTHHTISMLFTCSTYI